MARVSVADMYGPVEWIDHPPEIDPSFVDEVPLIPDKALQAILDPYIKNCLDEFVGFREPCVWALFPALVGYRSRLKKLFKQKVLDFDTEIAIETLDNLHESGVATDTEEGEALYAMLFELTNLNKLLEQIQLNILSILKT